MEHAARLNLVLSANRRLARCHPFADRPEVNLGFEAVRSEQFRQIRAELGEDRVSPVAAGMADPRGAVFDRAVGQNDRTWECLLRTWEEPAQ